MVKLFGTTVKETLNAINPNPVHLGDNNPSSANENDKIKAIGRIIVTVVLLGFSIYLSLYSDNSELGSTMIGGIIGYWLK
ncbi:hypothetical protein [Pseudozobellia sp. WGM2]|uniref:hypothetical protein n=1 Tax=Pseudozobellia sp. WGM2 TaxID=2787625 RepID=UPI001ADFF43E|nr:hypothetical protein [Pseudozobellia sp. WGM2]